jgi:phospholipid-binding lipoprotein MlaA
MKIKRNILIPFTLVFLVSIFEYCVYCPKVLAEEASLPAQTSESSVSQNEHDEWIDLLEEEPVPQVYDPLERLNRGIFIFNDFFYFNVLKPVAQGYSFITPEPVRVRVKNFFYNIGYPVRVVNDLLQAKFKRAGQNTCRFVFNSTAGVLGFFNPAQNYSWLNPPSEDTGQTLGDWGIGNGFYIVLPFLGPCTLRDSVGLVGDVFLQPVHYIRPFYIPMSIKAYEDINYTSLSIGKYEDFKESALDPYIAFREAYIQKRYDLVKE